MSEVTPADDGFHPAGDDHPHWTETAWFGFSVPERNLAGTIYPMFRPNLGVCSLGVYVWDDTACEPWAVRYGRGQWHLPMPAADLTALRVGGLELLCEKPLARYRIRYEDGARISLDLTYEGLIAPHGFGIGGGRGHLDQPCHVRGTLRLGDEKIPVDGPEMRDRSWSVRDDARTTRASYSYGIASEREMFLAGGFATGEAFAIVAGFLVRDGVKADLVSGTRRILASDDGYPTRVVVEARDANDRTLCVEGRCTSRLANQSTPRLFAWLSLTQWSRLGAPAHGQDQDVHSPDLLGG